MPTLSPNTVTAQSLGSGSSGNALVIRAGETTVLVDCGIGIRKLRAGLADHGLATGDLNAVLVTHEHRDHIQTLPKILRDDLPVVATSGTAIRAKLPRETTELINGRPVDIAGVTVHALAVRHDASEPCGFHIEVGGARITVLTDLGSWQDQLVDAVTSSDLVLLEANYNETMLAHGPYPAHLKRRVSSGVGHLGNDACAAAMVTALRTSRVEATWWLSHLSQTNNSPRQAERDVREALLRADLEANVRALPRRESGPLWTFDPASRVSRKPRVDPMPASDGTAQLGLPGLD